MKEIKLSNSTKIYIADDGTQFTDKSLAQRYNDSLLRHRIYEKYHIQEEKEFGDTKELLLEWEKEVIIKYCYLTQINNTTTEDFCFLYPYLKQHPNVLLNLKPGWNVIIESVYFTEDYLVEVTIIPLDQVIAKKQKYLEKLTKLAKSSPDIKIQNNRNEEQYSNDTKVHHN